MIAAQQLIQEYSLLQHPEGGWFKETYKCEEVIRANALPARFGGDRHISTAIYFLMEQNDFSAFHRIKSDECWHFYAGGSLSVYELDDVGTMKVIQLGNDISKGQVFQYVVPANRWFASRPLAGNDFSFVACTVAPGFDFLDFEMADRMILSEQYPQHKTIIMELTR